MKLKFSIDNLILIDSIYRNVARFQTGAAWKTSFFFVNKVHILTECCENVLFWIHSLTRICFTDFWRKMYSTEWHAVIWTLLEKFCKLDEFNQCLMCYLFIYFLCTICVHLYNSISPKYAQNISWSNALIG